MWRRYLAALSDHEVRRRLVTTCEDLEAEGALVADWRGMVSGDDFRGLERALTCAAYAGCRRSAQAPRS